MIKNWDKLKDDATREAVRSWSKLTTVTINDDGLYMLDIMTCPATPGAYIKEINEED